MTRTQFLSNILLGKAYDTTYRVFEHMFLEKYEIKVLQTFN